MESYKRIKSRNDQAISKHHNSKQQMWTSPPEDWYKVNVDAAIKNSDQQAGLGVVIRGGRGKIVVAAVREFCTKVMWRAWRLKLCIQNAIQVNCVPMILEPDSLEVVELSLNRKRSITEIYWKIEEIQASLKIQNPSRIQYVPNGCNYIAHSVAKIALNFETPVLWKEIFPDDVMMLLSKFI